MVYEDSSLNRLKLHEFYNQKENVDVVFIGNSRVLNGIDPTVADDVLGCNTFNLGTSSQQWVASYYLIKEAVDKYNIKTVFMNMEFTGLDNELGKVKENYIISDHIKGPNKYGLIFDAASKKDWFTMLSGIYRNKNNISMEFCYKNYMAKTSDDYKNYNNSNEYYTSYNYYINKGLAYTDKVNKGYDYFAYDVDYDQFDKVDISAKNQENIQYIIDSIEFCKKKGVEIILFTTPQTKFYLSNAGEYEEYVQYMNSFANEHGVKYYNFNLLEENFSDKEFANLDHLTQEGAAHFTKVLCDVYRNPQKYKFYDSLSEVSWDGVLGVKYNVEDKGSKIQYTWNVYDADNSEYMYKVYTYSGDMTLLYQSEMLNINSIEFTEAPKNVVIEIYDMSGNYIGNAKFL